MDFVLFIYFADFFFFFHNAIIYCIHEQSFDTKIVAGFNERSLLGKFYRRIDPIYKIHVIFFQFLILGNFCFKFKCTNGRQNGEKRKYFFFFSDTYTQTNEVSLDICRTIMNSGVLYHFKCI